MARNTKAKPALRAHVPWRYFDIINKRTCLHVDAWLYESTTGEYYFEIVLSAGGHYIISVAYFRADRLVGLMPVQRPDTLADAMRRYVDSPRERSRAPWLAAIHWREIYPALRTPRDGFKGPVSVVLHYIYTAPDVSEPTAGLENLYAVTGLAGRDAVRVVYGPYSTAEPGPSWDSRQRSTLRTLNKLLN